MARTYLAAVVCIGFVGVSAAWAERPPQPKSEAALVFDGVVESVELTKEDGVDYYLIAIKSEKIHKGDVLTAGKTCKVFCWRVTRFRPGTAGAAGHAAIPEKGARIKVYANKYESRGGFEALYPNWFEKLEAGGTAKKK
jgi:hypothetical protein